MKVNRSYPSEEDLRQVGCPLFEEDDFIGSVGFLADVFNEIDAAGYIVAVTVIARPRDLVAGGGDGIFAQQQTAHIIYTDRVR